MKPSPAFWKPATVSKYPSRRRIACGIFSVFAQLTITDVGALIERPRREMFRVRIGFRRIRNIGPQRAINDRPYKIHIALCNKL